MSPTLRGAAAMQQVSDWLEKLGLGQYAQRFAGNDISFSVLPDLTDQDLKDIGVSLGHRRQLLRAIAKLSSRKKDAPSAAAPTTPTAAPRIPPRTCSVSHGSASIILSSSSAFSINSTAREFPLAAKERIEAARYCLLVL